MATTFSTPTGLLTPELRHLIFYMYPTNTVPQIFSLSIRRPAYKCTLMYVYRTIAPSIHPNHHLELNYMYTSRTTNFDTRGNKIS